MFRVWAPERRRVELVVFSQEGGMSPRPVHRVPMHKGDDGAHEVEIAVERCDVLYSFSPDGEGPFPDPASRSQPFGVHGPSQVLDTLRFQWTDERWRGRPLRELVVYEAHVGTVTEAGTFDALREKLRTIAQLGVTAIELMPVADFAGDRNWGYDGVALRAPARCYGRPADLARVVDEAHAVGLSVILDVVLNHLGPAGNYLSSFSRRYFADRHETPWGAALNFDGEGSTAVRAFAVETAEMWVRDYHIDGLRLDATHAIIDESERHVLAEVAERVRSTGAPREIVVIAEDERNEARLVRSPAQGGLGLDGVWADDFHHEVRRLVAGDDEGYFADFAGSVGELATIVEKGWLYEGQISRYRDAPRGTPIDGIAPWQLVHCIQNHDQIGNRARGDRLHQSADLARVRAATALLLLSPFTPMLFMGEEFCASSPFAYFTDHVPDLGRLVTEGRRQAFAKFRAFREPTARQGVPDPQDVETFLASKLRWEEAERSPGREMRALHRELLALRHNEPAFGRRDRSSFDARAIDDVLCLHRRDEGEGAEAWVLVALTGAREIALGSFGVPADHVVRVLDTEDARFGGAGAAVRAGGALRMHAAGAVVLRRAPGQQGRGG